MMSLKWRSWGWLKKGVHWFVLKMSEWNFKMADGLKMDARRGEGGGRVGWAAHPNPPLQVSSVARLSPFVSNLLYTASYKTKMNTVSIKMCIIKM